MLPGDGSERGARDADVVPLGVGGHRLAPLQQGVAAERDHDAHELLCAPPQAIVATRIDLMVCIRFSAWSKTIDALDSKTSSVTSIASMPNFS